MKIFFDMDGTIANLYGVPNWLDQLQAESVDPYLVAPPLCDMGELVRVCEMLQYLGVEIGIISWCSKVSTREYDAAIRKAKRQWLKENFPIKFDEIHIVKYGTPKQNFCHSETDVLFDDELPNREKWENKGGQAVNPVEQNIAEFLRQFLPDET